MVTVYTAMITVAQREVKNGDGIYCSDNSGAKGREDTSFAFKSQPPPTLLPCVSY